jgi:hypothetical protein
VATAALVAVCVSACASAPADKSRKSGVLEVANPAPKTMEVFWGPDLLGTVEPGTVEEFWAIPPGVWTLSATPRGETAAPRTAEVSVEEGGRTRWRIPLSGDEVPVELPPGVGTVLATNSLPVQLALFVDDVEAGQVLPGETRPITGVAAGSRALRARLFGTEREVAQTVEVTTDDTLTVVLDLPRGSLWLDNGSSEAITVTLDPNTALAQAPVSLEPGQRHRLEGLLEGMHSIEVFARASGRIAEVAFRIEPDQEHTYTFAAADAGLTFENDSPESVELALDGEVLATVAANDSASLDAIRPGTRELVATGLSTGMRYEATIRLGTGQRAAWRISGNLGAAAVHNGLGEKVELFVDRVPAGELAPGESKFLSALPAKRTRLEAVGKTSRRALGIRGDITPERTFEWSLSADTATVIFRSVRDDSVKLYIDGAMVGELPAEGTLTVEGVVPGERGIAARGALSRWDFETKLPVPEEGVTTLDVERPHFTVRVENRSDEAVVPGPMLGSALPPLRPGESARFELPPGAWALSLAGQRSALAYENRLEGTHGQELEWLVERQTGGIHVFNRRAEPVVLIIDGAVVGKVEPGKDGVIGDVAVGAHQVSAVGEQTGYELRTTTVVQLGKAIPLELKTQLASLRVVNQTGEPLALEIDGRPYGRIERDQAAGFGNIQPQKHKVRAAGQKTGKLYGVDAQFEEGILQVWEIYAERSQVRVDNQRAEAVALSIDGVERPALPARSSGSTSVAQGNHSVVAMGEESRVPAKTALAVAPEVTYDVAVRPATAQLRVRNDTEYTLELTCAGAVLGYAYAGQETVVPGVPAGPQVIRATEHPVAGEHSFTRSVVVAGGEEIPWTIRVPPSEDRPAP